MDITFTTINSDGILFWQGSYNSVGGGFFLAIVIRGGVLSVDFIFDLQMKTINSEVSVNDGVPTKMTLQIFTKSPVRLQQLVNLIQSDRYDL